MKQKSHFLKWTWQDFLQVMMGSLLFAIGINFFIVPNSLYNGGVLGISQLIRSLLESVFHCHFSFDIAGIINFILNIPLFFIAYRLVNRTFFYRTVTCVLLDSLCLTIVPVLKVSIVPEILTSVLIGAILAGIGGGLIFACGGSGGGTDIIGFILSMNKRRLSIGKISRSINLIIYTICGVIYGLPIMIYSIIYSFISSLVVDRLHKQNICSSVMIFTKDKPDKVIDFIKTDLHRDCTYWDAYGGYDQSKTYISYSAMSKYELQILERNIPSLSPNAFLVKSEGIGIDGNFKKNFLDF